MVKHWLLLRGLAREAWHWGEFPRQVRQRLDAERVLCLDLPSIGAVAGGRTALSIDGIVDDLRRRWHTVAGEGAGSWGVIGQSLGGMVAVAWCHRYPSDFVAAVTINTSAANLAPPFRRFSFKTLPAVLTALVSSSPLRRERTILALTSNRPEQRLHLLPAWAAHAAASPVKRRTFLTQLWAAATYSVPSRLTTPLLVLASRADRLVDVRCSRRLAARLCAPIAEHDWAGHDLPLDDPEWVIEAIAQKYGRCIPQVVTLNATPPATIR
jgi:pimeloyl-[acyl-carrier protein] methyl ester esterase